MNAEHHLNNFGRNITELYDRLLKTFNRSGSAYIPDCDVICNDNVYHVYVDLPGFNKNDIKISLQDGGIQIIGKRSWDEKKDDESLIWIQKNRFFGGFCHFIHLSGDVKCSEIEAQLENGVLHIMVKLSESIYQKKITIK